MDTANEAQADRKSSKPAETIEEAARRLRYAWFRQVLVSENLDAIATAHTLDDQAETVLAKFLRGAWTEGLSGIHPKLESPEGREKLFGRCWRSTRAEIEAYLRELGQGWREDSSNRHLTFTRNRIRHELLPLLEGWNPRLREHMAQMAALARDEEAWWQAELARLAPQLLLPGRPVRGGGRAAGGGLDSGLAIEVSWLAKLAPAMQRRLIRYAAKKFGIDLDFAATEAVRSLALDGRAGQKLALPHNLCAERTARELRLSIHLSPTPKKHGSATASRIFGDNSRRDRCARLRASTPHRDSRRQTARLTQPRTAVATLTDKTAILRNCEARRPSQASPHSAGPRKVKEVLERLRGYRVGPKRGTGQFSKLGDKIVWMLGGRNWSPIRS